MSEQTVFTTVVDTDMAEAISGLLWESEGGTTLFEADESKRNAVLAHLRSKKGGELAVALLYHWTSIFQQSGISDGYRDPHETTFDVLEALYDSKPYRAVRKKRMTEFTFQVVTVRTEKEVEMTVEDERGRGRGSVQGREISTRWELRFSE